MSDNKFTIKDLADYLSKSKLGKDKKTAFLDLISDLPATPSTPQDLTNISLWEKLSTEVDPRFLSNYVSDDGTNTTLTAISHMHGRNAMTAIFGPCGTGWGYRVLSLEKVNAFTAMKVEMWYKPSKFDPSYGKDEIASVEEYGTATIAGRECFKQMLSSALNRCFMTLGHAAYIYSGFSENPNAVTSPQEPIQDAVEQSDSNIASEIEENVAITDNASEPEAKETTLESTTDEPLETPAEEKLPDISVTLTPSSESILNSVDEIVSGVLQEDLLPVPNHPFHLLMEKYYELNETNIQFFSILEPNSKNLDDSYRFSSKLNMFVKSINGSELTYIPSDSSARAYFSTNDEKIGQPLVDTLGFDLKDGVFSKVFTENEALAVI